MGGCAKLPVTQWPLNQLLLSVCIVRKCDGKFLPVTDRSNMADHNDDYILFNNGPAINAGLEMCFPQEFCHHVTMEDVKYQNLQNKKSIREFSGFSIGMWDIAVDESELCSAELML